VKKYALLLLLLLPTPLFARPEAIPPQNSLVFTHVTVIDATGAAAQPDMTVLITGDRIAALGETGKVSLPQDAQQVDATGQFLIPGLWDMHAHWSDRIAPAAPYLELFTANGVTGIRQMWGFPSHFRWREEIAAGTLRGPRMALAGPIIDGPKPAWRGSTAAGTEAEGRRAVRKTREDGYDFVKVYSGLPREVYFAIADEAKKQGLPFVGHVPYSVTVGEASDAGQKSVEHLSGILLACSSRQAELTKDLAIAQREDAARPDRTLLRRVNEQLLDTYDATKAAALFARLKANGTWQVPTLTVLRVLGNLDDRDFTNDTRLRYMPPAVRDCWNPKYDFLLKAMTQEDFALQRRMFKRYLELVGAMHRAGVEMLAGSDSPNPYCFPGFSLHDELELLVSAGLSPMEALQTATRNPARYLDQSKDIGTVEQGKIADLVLLEADPLQDIRNTQKIAAAVVGGRLLPRGALQAMLAEVEAAANKK
jgi:imidazolonepropionase-like amidohydrolase